MDRGTAERLIQPYSQFDELFNEAHTVIHALPDQEEQKRLRQPMTRAMVGLRTDFMFPIVREFPDLDPDKEQREPDPELSPDELARVAQLTESDVMRIDAVLVAAASVNWRKVARIVGTAMNEPTRLPGVPDIYYAERVRKLVEAGRLESQGNLGYMRYSEVRLPIQRSSPQP